MDPFRVMSSALQAMPRGARPVLAQSLFDAGTPARRCGDLVLDARGQGDVAANLLAGQGLAPAVDNTYQYIPYRFDSPFEQAFYKLVMGLDLVDDLGLEVYYNGDNTVADFRIDCYKKSGSTWKKVGKYTPDFLIIHRADGAIDKVLIVETKGLGYSRERGFVERREYMEKVFIPQNNARFGRKRFDYRVLTDNYDVGELRQMTEDLLHECFA